MRTDIVDALATYFVSRAVRLLVFQSGWSYLGKDYTVLIPIAMSDTIEATVEETKRQRRTIFTFMS